jgi:uncharacterized membrane-anchored protein YhcB (DUF1043 family)
MEYSKSYFVNFFRKLINRNLVLVLQYLTIFLISISLYSQENNSTISLKNVLPKKDIYGRNYLENRYGEIRFLVDDDYKLKFPHSSQLTIHFAEASELLKYQIIDSIELRKNLDFCSVILENEEKEKYQKEFFENKKALNQILSNYNVNEVDAYRFNKDFCNTNNGLYFRSEFIPLKILVPLDLNFSIALKNHYNYKWEEGNQYELIPFQKIISRETINEDESSLEELFPIYTGEKSLKKSNSVRLIFGLSKHKSDILSEIFLVNFWDSKRGLVSTEKRNLNFQRKKMENGYSSSWYQRQEDFKKEKYISSEFYFFHGKKALSIFFIYPENYKEESQILWKKISGSIVFRGKKLFPNS